jgi:hypothetical protein
MKKVIKTLVLTWKTKGLSQRLYLRGWLKKQNCQKIWQLHKCELGLPKELINRIDKHMQTIPLLKGL